jgi:hypothetical protein
MAERDAFGNKKGDDDALADMGWSLSGGAVSMPETSTVSAPSDVPSAPPPPAPAPAVTVSAPSAPSYSPGPIPGPSSLPNIPGPGRGFNVGGAIARLVGIAITLAVFGAIAAAIIAGVNSVGDKVKSVTDSFTVPTFTSPTTTGNSPTTPGKTAKPTSPPSGLAPGSMMRADRFGVALRRFRAVGSRAQTMRVDAQRVSGNILDKSGRMTVVSFSWDGQSQVVRTSANLSAASAVSLKGVTSKAPSRAVARAAAAHGRPARDVNYLVLTNFAGTSKWFVYFKDGSYFSASLDGRKVQRIT